jgi:signal transduction histidine kinase
MTAGSRTLAVAAAVLGAGALCWIGLLALGAAARTGPDPWLSGAVIGGIALAAVLACAAGGSDRTAAVLAAGAVRAAGLCLGLMLAALVAALALGRLPAGRERQLVWPAALGAAAAVLATRPLQGGLMAGAARLLPPLRRGAADVPARVAALGAQDIPLEEVLLRAAELLRASLRSDSVQVWAAPSSHEPPIRVVALPRRLEAPPPALSRDERSALARAGVAGRSWLQMWLPSLLEGIETDQVRIAPATYQNALLGWILATRPAGAAVFEPADDAALAQTAERLAIVLHNRQLSGALHASLRDLSRANEALATSRRRLVAAADAERRRIERDLHDGAQQHLVALGVNLSVARGLLSADPLEADHLLAAMSTQLRDAARELRDLAHGIYPALLKEGGLPHALAGSLARAGRQIRIDVDGIGRLDPTVEAAIYFCCVEAVQNTVKHAPGAAVQLRLGRDGRGVWFTVADEGPGFDPARTAAGFGRQSMTDRLGAVDGIVRWESARGCGTTVFGYVPIGVEPADVEPIGVEPADVEPASGRTGQQAGGSAS